MGIIGRRFVDIFLGIPGARRFLKLAPWPDEQSRALFWGIATLIDSAADAARQAVRLHIGAPEWPLDAIAYLAKNRGLLVPGSHMSVADSRAWINGQWSQHAIAGTGAGIVAGCAVSHPQAIVRVDAVTDGWVLVLPESVGIPEWDDGTDWDEGPAWDVAVDNLEVLYRAARYWGPAKQFLGAVVTP